VLHNARLYDRMGCDLLGLDLGTFFYHSSPVANRFNRGVGILTS